MHSPLRQHLQEKEKKKKVRFMRVASLITRPYDDENSASLLPRPVRYACVGLEHSSAMVMFDVAMSNGALLDYAP